MIYVFISLFVIFLLCSSISSVKIGVFYGTYIIIWPEFYRTLERKV